ncbi:hypothetical protein RQM47_05435 [Rubrivirga sp. S365]|uniref:hypothetical protein n=1 Tax=Rubrivirga sp. S365 TaxID=3076080 RepID=UPI0028C87708|nr:hypothetical protein [Rubrivirga sp. S365]MDT7856076.1 hypothetical protein [Rubrivirga sp. S365]
MTALAALLVALALAAPPRAAALLAPPGMPCPGGRVLTRADLEAGGARHLRDVLRLAGLDAVTVDGYDVEPVVAWGLPSAARLRVLVDGAPAAAATSLEPAGFEALPVALGEVARVVVCPGPGVAGGAWGGPWIDVETAPPARHAYGAVDYGNETGDPGPDRYLDRSLPNVDHWGPDAEGALVAPWRSAGGGAAWAVLREHRLLPTDTAIAPRVFAAVAPDRYPSRVLRTAAAALDAGGVRVRAGGRWGDDLPHLAELGREMPTSRRSVQASVSAARGAGPVALRGHVAAARFSLDRPAWGRLPAPLGWTETRLDAAVSARAGRLAAGVQAEHTAASGPGLTDGAVGAGRAWAQVGRPARRLTVQASVSESALSVGGAAEVARRVGPAQLRLTLAVDRTPPRPGPALWARRGYAGLDVPGRPALDAGPPRPTSLALARLGAVVERGGARVEASVEAQGARGPILRPALVPGGVAVGGAFRSVEAEGVTIVARAAASGGAGWLALRASATARGALVGDDAFALAWRRLPAVRGRVEATVRPDERLSLHAALSAWSGAAWTGYPEPDVPSAVVLNLALGKRAWGDRLRFAVTARNALDARERTHPLGAVLAPRLFARAEVRL